VEPVTASGFVGKLANKLVDKKHASKKNAILYFDILIE
jgi:hypothetical protein